MAYDPNVLRRATEELERRSREHQLNTARRRAKLYAAEPELDRLDRSLQATMAQLAAAALRKGESVRKAVEEIRADNLALQTRRTQLLAKHGFGSDALENAPLCPHCGDSGWKGVQMCECLKQIYAAEQIRELSTLLDLAGQSFDTFRLDYYSPQSQNGQESCRDSMGRVLQICKAYAKNFGSFAIHNLYLFGQPGLGKTFLSACIAREVSEQGRSVVYDTAGNIFTQFEDRKFSRGEDNRDARDETHRYLNCDLLILDDLGSEMTTQFTQTALYELINTRLVGGKHTVISSNYSPVELEQRYSPQIVSRLKGEYHHLRFCGQDIRTLKKQR